MSQADRHADLLVRFGEVLRDGLAAASGREALELVLASLSRALAVPAVVVLRGEAGELVVEGLHGYAPEHLPEGERLPADRGVVGAAFTSGEAVYVPRREEDARWFDASGGRFRSAVAVPMRLPDRTWGVLALEHERPDAFDPVVRRALVPLADQLAWALESTRLREEAERRAAVERRLRTGLEAIAAVVNEGLRAGDQEEALARIGRAIGDRLGWDDVQVRLGEEEGAPAEQLVVPLRAEGGARGAIRASSQAGFDAVDQDLVHRLADQVSLVLRNLELLRNEQETVARLHELDRLKSQLLSIASHELRTPLTVVLGFAEVLARNAADFGPAEVASFADAVRRQASSLSRLVDQMLVAAEIEEGRLAIASASVPLAGTVVQVVEEFDDRARIEVGDGVAEAHVHADPFRLQQVLRSLLDNAVTYAEEGVIQIDARSRDGHVDVLVRDEGPGIPGAEHDRVFEAFHQHGPHGIAGRRGVGLGLTVARDLTRLMGGELRLASAPGYGATFLLSLPRADPVVHPSRPEA